MLKQNINNDIKTMFDIYQYNFKLNKKQLTNSILDIGCSKGEFISYVRDMYNNNQALGLDYIQKGEPKDYIIIGDGREMPFDNNTFETVVARNYVSMYTNVDKRPLFKVIMNEALRVLKTGGSFYSNIFSEYNVRVMVENHKDAMILEDEMKRLEVQYNYLKSLDLDRYKYEFLERGIDILVLKITKIK